MKNTEIKEVREYCWGSIITTIEDKDKPDTIIMARLVIVAGASLLLTLAAFLLGFVIGKF